jgi:ankyrin repeat protein
MVQALLAAGADPSASQEKGGGQQGIGTPLLYMLQQQYENPHTGKPHQCGPQCNAAAAVVQQLVAAGAQTQVVVKDSSMEGPTPLHYAAAAGCGTLVACLLQAGADASCATPPPYMYTVLHAAASSGSLEVVQQVLAALGAKAQAKLRYLGKWPAGRGSSAWRTPLHLAAEGGHVEVVEVLVAAGADLNKQDSQCSVPLHLAAAAGALGVVKVSLAAGADPNQPNQDKATALHLAAAGGHREVVEVLVAAGADKDRQDANSYTPLHRAVVASKHRLVPLLVTPTNINHAVGERTPLHLAASHWQPTSDTAAAVAGAVSQLLAAGADASPKDLFGQTALTLAAGQGSPEVFQVLLQHHLQQPMGRDQLLAGLQEAADKALSLGRGRQWSLLASTVLDELGEEGVRRLWDTFKQKLQQQEQESARDTPPRASRAASGEPPRMLEAWSAAWVSGSAELATRVTQRLRQLVINPQQQQRQQQQQQQQVSTSASAQQAAVPPGLAISVGASTVARVQLQAAAASGSGEQVQATTTQVASRQAGLSTAAVAAAEGGDWGVCMRLLRELAVQDASKAQAAVRAVHAAISRQQQEAEQEQQATALEDPPELPQWLLELEDADLLHDVLEYWQQRQARRQQERRKEQADIQAAVRVADALLADWLADWRQRARELKGAVVAAVQCVLPAANANR